MSEQEKKEAIVTTGEVTETKKSLLKRLWEKPIVQKIAKGAAAVGLCVASGLVGYKLGKNDVPEMTALPDGEETDEDDDE